MVLCLHENTEAGVSLLTLHALSNHNETHGAFDSGTRGDS